MKEVDTIMFGMFGPQPGGPWGHGGGPWEHHGRGSRRGPWGPGFRFPGGPRARRGDVRAAILTLLVERPMHGYEMIRELESRSGGVWRPSAGSIYPTLQLLEDEGLVRGEESEGRRLFALTEAGRTESERLQHATPPWQEVADEVSPPAFQLRNAAFQLGAAVLQVGQAGDDDQVKRTLEIMNDARRRIYGILGETVE
ncbi:MAG: PadR family transcriptional regulator [Candidatus Dormiibacterota bacterium]